MKCQDLIEYYIIDRKTGKTYTPDVCMNSYLTAYSNVATDAKQVYINFYKIVKGIAERRYRLVKRNEYL